jgi:hypothetical protein
MSILFSSRPMVFAIIKQKWCDKNIFNYKPWHPKHDRGIERRKEKDKLYWLSTVPVYKSCMFILFLFVAL